MIDTDHGFFSFERHEGTPSRSVANREATAEPAHSLASYRRFWGWGTECVAAASEMFHKRAFTMQNGACWVRTVVDRAKGQALCVRRPQPVQPRSTSEPNRPESPGGLNVGSWTRNGARSPGLAPPAVVAM